MPSLRDVYSAVPLAVQHIARRRANDTRLLQNEGVGIARKRQYFGGGMVEILGARRLSRRSWFHACSTASLDDAKRA